MKSKNQFSLAFLQELIEGLRLTANTWVPQMFPAGRRVGRDWRIGDIDGRKGMSMSIRLSGEKGGCFIDHANGDVMSGGPIELIRQAHNLSFVDAVKYAVDIARKPMPKFVDDKPEQYYVEKDKARVMQLYGKRKTIKKSIVEDYLELRGLKTDLLDDIFFHPRLPYWPDKSNMPGMLGIVRNVDGEIIGIHRTYLDEATKKKADVTPNKMMMGNIAGGAVRLFKCIGAKVGIAEGIETAIAAKQLFNLPVWAGLSAAGIINFQVPKNIKEVIIFSDHDEPGRNAAAKLQERLESENIIVSVALPKIIGWDFNDQLLDKINNRGAI